MQLPDNQFLGRLNALPFVHVGFFNANFVIITLTGRSVGLVPALESCQQLNAGYVPQTGPHTFPPFPLSLL